MGVEGGMEAQGLGASEGCSTWAMVDGMVREPEFPKVVRHVGKWRIRVVDAERVLAFGSDKFSGIVKIELFE